MRTNIVIDDQLMQEALAATGLRTKREVVEAGLKTLVRLALGGAEHFRHLRRRGVTVAKSVDTIIATFCIDRDIPLLHRDRDFEPFRRHLGLRVL